MAKVSYPKYYGRLLKGSGYSLAKGLALPFVRREAVRSGAHEMAFPISSYAPWQADEEFVRVYRQVRKHTLVDVWRCYELWSLVGELRDLRGAILEVGVWRGGTGALMASRARAKDIDDPIYLCDTWEGVVKSGEVDTYYSGGEHADTSREIVAGLGRQLGLENVALLKGTFPDETADQVTAEELRLVHVDVDVYQSAKDVFEWAWPRLVPGGVAVFDDFGFPCCPGVTQIVNEQRDLPDRIVLHNLNGHGIVIKR